MSVTPIGQIDNVKQLAGGYGPRSGMTDDMYADIISRWDAHIRTATQKYDWSETDADFNTFRGIVERFAAAEIRWSFNRSDSEATKFFKEASEWLNEMVSKSTAAGASKTPNISKKFGSYPTNASALPFFAIKRTGEFRDRFGVMIL